MAAHQTSIEIDPSVPAELEAGTDITLRPKVTCAEGCDLCGYPIRVKAGEEIIYTGAVEHSSVITMRAPGKLGVHAWTVMLPGLEVEGVIHEESSLVVSFTTLPHTTSMALWSVPSPVVMNDSFAVKVGVKCSVSCPMGGRFIEVFDAAGVRIGKGHLGETPWPGSTALYVADVELVAPAAEGMVSWSARFAASDFGLPHAETSVLFSFRTVRPPEYSVTVQVTQKDTECPLENVDVRLGVYRASTDTRGRASFALPAGVYDLAAWKAGYETSPRMVEVADNLMVRLEAVCCPPEDPDDSQVWM